MSLLSLQSNTLSPFTGFGDDPNWSVKFGVRKDRARLADWESGLRMARLPLATGNGEITQRRGRDPWTLTWRLWFATVEDLDRLDAMVGRRATLRYRSNLTKRGGGSLQTIEDRTYLVFPGTMLIELTDIEVAPDGRCEATATFTRPYVDPPAFVPPVWPAPPYPGVRLLPDPLLFLTQPLSRNAAGAISPASGAARVTTLDGYAAWRIIPAAKNGIYNPLFSAMTNWTAELGATLTANGDGTARVQTSAIYQGITAAPGTALAAVQGETVTIVVSARSRTVTRTMDLQFYAHSANNHGGNTSDLSKTTVNVSTSWQRFSHTRTLTDAATQFVFLRFTTPDSTVRDIDIREPMVFKGSVIPEFVPAVDGLGVLLPGDTWDGGANASPSTRAVGSVGGALASFGSLYLRYSTDGSTVVNTVLTGPGTFGGIGTVAFSGGVLTITSSAPLWIGAAIMYPTLTGGQKTYLDSVATSALTWSM